MCCRREKNELQTKLAKETEKLKSTNEALKTTEAARSNLE